MISKNRFGGKKRFVLLVGLLFLIGRLSAADKGKGSDDYGSVIALSPYEVSARSMEFSHWLRLTSPNFIVYTDASSREAREISKHLEMLHQAAQFFLKRRSTQQAPLMVILPTGKSDWKKIKSKGSVEWQVATSMVGTVQRIILAEYDWQGDGLGSVWSMEGIAEVDAMNLNTPFWLQRGVMSFFRTVTFDGDSLNMGKQSWTSTYIQRAGWMDWPQFFKIDGHSPVFLKEGSPHDQYEGQATVFVHYVLTNSDPQWTQRLLTWAAFHDAGNEATDESFQQVFGVNYKTWQNKMDNMLHGGSYTTGNIKFPPAALNFEITSSGPSAREMRELFVLAQILNQQTKESTASLDTLLTRGLKTDSLRALLAEACGHRERPEAQIKVMRELITENSPYAPVYAHAAKILLASKKAEHRIDVRLENELEEIRAWCRRALEIEPLNLEANETLAWAEASAPQVEKQNLETIVAICRALDGHAQTDQALAALAVARWRAGTPKQATKLCETIKRSPMSHPSARKVADEVLARISAGAPTP